MNIKLSITFFILLLNLFLVSYGQKQISKKLIASGPVEIKGIDNIDIFYDYDAYENKHYCYVYLKKNINTKHNPIYKNVDSLRISKAKWKRNYYLTDTGEFEIENKKYGSLPAIVKKEKYYYGEWYRKIYRAWYYDLKNEIIKEIKLPNPKFKAYCEPDED